MTPVHDAASALTDTITFLQCKQPLVLTKVWHNGSIKDYDTAKHFKVNIKPVNNLKQLAALLTTASTKPQYAAIRGTPKVDTVTDVTRTMANFSDTPKHWVMFDIDAFTPEVLPQTDPADGVLEWIHKVLPAYFHNVSCFWQLSASAGHSTRDPKGLRAHVWFWLDTSVTGKQWKRWVEHNNIKVDKSVFSPVQLHYTANPVIELGADPYTSRSGIIKGLPAVEVALCRFAAIEDTTTTVNAYGDTVLRDPRQVPGIVGEFCSKVSILTVITDIIPGIFVPSCNSSNEWDGRRLDFLQGSGGQGGAFIHSDGLHLINMQTHAPDNTQQKALNAFDLVRVYKFSDFDPDDLFLRLDVTNMPSHKSMVDFAKAWVLVEEPQDGQTGPEQTETLSLDVSIQKETKPTKSPEIEFPDPFPGAMTDMVNAVMATANRPQEKLTTLGALIGMAAACGSHYHLPDGLRFNMYGIMLSNTGTGKEKAAETSWRVAVTADTVAAGCPASGQGLQDMLLPNAGLLLDIKEIGHVLEAMSAKNAASHITELGRSLLDLYSASQSCFRVRLKAKPGPVAKTPVPTVIDHSAGVIEHPAVSLIGATTRAKLSTAISKLDVDNGFIGRFLFADGLAHVDLIDQNKKFQIPATVEFKAKKIAWNAAKSVTVDYSPEGSAALVQALKKCNKASASKDQWAAAFATRRYEKTKRIAGCLAVWDAPEAPTVRPEHIQWALQYVTASDNVISQFLLNDLGGEDPGFTDAMSLRTKLEKLAAKPGCVDGWVKRNDLMRASNWDKRKFLGGYETLLESGRIEEKAVKDGATGAKKPTCFVRVA